MTRNTETVTIHADELTEGDIIRHFTGELWQVYSEPEYTVSGIVFEVLPLDLDTNETQIVAFHPQWRFELVNYNSEFRIPNSELVMEVAA